MDSPDHDVLNSIPKEIFRHIFDWCELESQISLTKTCKRFHSFTWLNEHWKKECMDRWDLYKRSPLLNNATLYHDNNYFVRIVESLPITWFKMANSFIHRNGGPSFRHRGLHVCFGEYDQDGNLIHEKPHLDICCSTFVGAKSSFSSLNPIFGYGSIIAFLGQDGRDIYRGQAAGNLFAGKGVMTTHDGTIYEGNWRNNSLVNGPGKISDTYSGITFGQLPENVVKVTCPDGWSWEGEWIKDVKARWDDGVTGKPADHFTCIHPDVSECNEKMICTRSLPQKVTPQLGQKRNGMWFCLSCLQNGHHEFRRPSQLQCGWVFDNQCKCTKEECMIEGGNAKKRKMK